MALALAFQISDNDRQFCAKYSEQIPVLAGAAWRASGVRIESDGDGQFTLVIGPHCHGFYAWIIHPGFSTGLKNFTCCFHQIRKGSHGSEEHGWATRRNATFSLF